MANSDRDLGIAPANTDPQRIRSFCIIAHIDHGKSTLADRMLGDTGVVSEREMREQYLDRMDIERERGITIKSQAVRMPWQVGDTHYVLNMIDTPGHVDFSYEVSRSLAACEGAILLIDSSQGIEAQTLANLYMAMEHDLVIIPVLNKIDLPAAQPERCAEEIAGLLGGSPEDCLRVSAKTGEGVPELLDRIVSDVPAPKSDRTQARALIFDSIYDTYRGVVTYVRMMDGSLKKGQRVKMMATGSEHELLEIGVISPEPTPAEGLGPGEVGYLITGAKDVRLSKVGDTVTSAKDPASEILPGYKEPKPMVYSGIYPVDGDDFPDLREALDRLQLNDAAITFEPETSVALGFGFRCGFLGLLHLEIVKERLEREAGLSIIVTAPSVIYQVTREDGTELEVTNPSEYPDGKVFDVQEPVVEATVLTPNDYVGRVMELCQGRRGTLGKMEYLSSDRVEMHYRLPLAEIVFDFFDQLKSRTRGFASLDYHEAGTQSADLVKVDVLLNGDVVDAFSAIVHRDAAYSYGDKMTRRLKELIPRQQFEIPVQAAVGSRIIARQTIRALRKDMLAKCYGGDISRKRKLLEKQKAGKKRMKAVGAVEIPNSAFIEAITQDTPTGKG